MENASKALIIAGAILLAILLISLGIMIFGQAQDTVNNSGMSQAEMQTFNNKFLKYEGEHKSGSEAKALINEVLASNSDDNNTNRQIVVKFKGKNARTGSTITTPSTLNSTYSTGAISNSGVYTIKLTYATEDSTTNKTTNGCVSLINIEQEGV